ncbi:MAG: hypothetical protein WKF87_03470 [Chryseolinea sp.]
MDKLLLGFVGLFKGVYRMAGVNYPQLLAIVAVKLKTDNRRQHISYRINTSRENGNAFLITLLIYIILGALMSLMIGAIQSIMLSMTVFYSFLIVMIAMTLITDFSAILLDTSDNTIILPRPVDGKTLYAARLTHIMLYLGQLGIGLTLVPAFVVSSKYGLGLLPPFLLIGILAIMLAVLITNSAYLLILHFSSEDKLKNVINYIQIGIAVICMGGYQIIPHLISGYDLGAMRVEISWWHYLMPPLWLAGTLEMVHLRQVDLGHIGMATCAVFIPIAGLVLVNKFLAPVFARKLGALAAVSTAVKRSDRAMSKLPYTISRFVTRPGPERAMFSAVFNTLARDRKIKLKIYPVIGYIAIFIFIFILQKNNSLDAIRENVVNNKYHLMLLYLPIMILQVALHEIPYSDEFKASWVYFSAPLVKPGELLSGMIKAIFVRLFLAGYVVLGLIVLIVVGRSAMADIFVAALNNYLMLMILAMIDTHKLPLSMEPEIRRQSGNMGRGIITVVILGSVTGAHYFILTFIPNVILALVPIQLAVSYLLHRTYKSTAWSEITL